MGDSGGSQGEEELEAFVFELKAFSMTAACMSVKLTSCFCHT